VIFDVHPDNLDISTRFNDLSVAQKGATLRHELGHAAVGLDHNHLCSSSVMAPLRYCNENDTPRRTTVGPHDVTDRDEYWNGATSIYPIHDKCWTNADADGDGVCDRHGAPELTPEATPKLSPRTFSASSVSNDQTVWAPPAVE
jgi:hypothetical protein